MFKFLNHLRKNKLNFKYLIKIHSKTDDTERHNHLNSLLPNDFTTRFKYIIKQNSIASANRRCSYDYYNIKHDIANIKMLNLNILTNWLKYDQHFPEVSNWTPIEKRYHALKNKERMSLTPDIDVPLYEHLFGTINDDHQRLSGNIKVHIINNILHQKLTKCFYFPGTMFMIKHNIFQKAFKNVDYEQIYQSLETGKPDDNKCQSKIHSWERVFTLIIQSHLKN